MYTNVKLYTEPTFQERVRVYEMQQNAQKNTKEHIINRKDIPQGTTRMTKATEVKDETKYLDEDEDHLEDGSSMATII
jgi:hypothetical protein